MFHRKSRGVSEVISSVLMLAITIAVLGGVGLLSLGSLRAANGLLASGSQNAANASGVLLTVVGTQANSTGAFIWLYDYGWSSTKLTSVYVDGGLVSGGWSTTCGDLQPQGICSVRLPTGTHGTVTLDFGVRTIGLSI